MEALPANCGERLPSSCGVRPITSYKFRVGETVDFKPGRMGFPAASRECTIVRQLPIEGGSRLYRIKCVTEAFERVVPEAQLAQRV
jgi:hypothetical protein